MSNAPSTDAAAPRSPAETPADPAWLRSLIQGDADTVDAWFGREHPEVYRLCLGILGSQAVAHDVAQDAMVHLLDTMERYDPARPWRPWRDTVVVRLCRDRLRRIAARDRAEEQAAEVRGEALADRPSSPARDLEAAEVHELIADALGALSPREREAFVLRDLEELSTRETAEVMGVTGSSVRSLLTLARRRLRQLLGPKLGQDEGGLS